ncbi:MAG: LssY C-terminal domain-containing protein [Planctomycetaceae bacterium]|nr:LssY C-terminal domain-containing protein [Planctomycetaceae bacterium]
MSDGESLGGQDRKDRRSLKLWHVGVFVLALYLLAAYLVVPFAWERYARRHPSFDDDPRITTTGDGHPGDPLNVALVGGEEEIKQVMHAAGWFPAAALGLKSDLKIAADTVLSRPDDEAPVSNLFLYGRKEDLAFEKPVGDSPRQRNHVRFWKEPRPDPDGQPVWIGSATFDKGVGLSHTTGQVTHHIAADVDTERDRLFHDLEQTGGLSETYIEAGFHHKLEGHNGGGDPWHTDGDLYVGVLKTP